MYVSFSDAAIADIDALEDHIAKDGGAVVARNVTAKILNSIEFLETFPLMGRIGRVENTRELVIPAIRIIVIYRFRDEFNLEIAEILHTSQKYPR